MLCMVSNVRSCYLLRMSCSEWCVLMLIQSVYELSEGKLDYSLSKCVSECIHMHVRAHLCTCLEDTYLSWLCLFLCVGLTACEGRLCVCA